MGVRAKANQQVWRLFCCSARDSGGRSKHASSTESGFCESKHSQEQPEPSSISVLSKLPLTASLAEPMASCICGRGCASRDADR